MAYNNGFPMGYQPYQPMYQQPQYVPQMPTLQQTQPPVTQNNQNNGIIWVQGEAGAKSYLVAPNNTVQLWDSEQQVIYLKSADASGMPSMKILDYTIRNNENHQNVVSVQPTVEYVTKDEFNAFVEKIQSQLDRPVKKDGGKKE